MTSAGHAPGRGGTQPRINCRAPGEKTAAFLPTFSYQTLVNVPDRPTPDDQPHTVQFRRISPDYSRTMQIKTIAGRYSPMQTPRIGRQWRSLAKRFAETLMPGLDPTLLLAGTDFQRAQSLRRVGRDEAMRLPEHHCLR